MRITKKDITVSEGCSFCPEEHFLCFGPPTKDNRVAYVRLRFGQLCLYPVDCGKIMFSKTPIYRHRFWNKFWFDKWKG